MVEPQNELKTQQFFKTQQYFETQGQKSTILCEKTLLDLDRI